MAPPSQEAINHSVAGLMMAIFSQDALGPMAGAPTIIKAMGHKMSLPSSLIKSVFVGTEPLKT